MLFRMFKLSSGFRDKNAYRNFAFKIILQQKISLDANIKFSYQEIIVVIAAIQINDRNVVCGLWLQKIISACQCCVTNTPEDPLQNQKLQIKNDLQKQLTGDFQRQEQKYLQKLGDLLMSENWILNHLVNC